MGRGGAGGGGYGFAGDGAGKGVGDAAEAKSEAAKSALSADTNGGGDPSWVVTLCELTGAGPVSSERLDVAKFVFIVLVCTGHFLEPFYKIGNKPTAAFMHAVYGFHVPAFVLISGYVSGDLNPKRRRALIGGIVAPFLLLHLLYSVWYTRAFCERDDGRQPCQFVNGWSLIDPVLGRWDGWDKWTFGYPFAHLWYFVSLLTKRVWRPFALEMRWTLLFHVVLGVLVGYTTVGRFLSLHRSTVHMPYFLAGFLMKKHSCFFPSARSFNAKAAALTGVVVIVACSCLAAFAWELEVEVWYQSDPHDSVYGARWAYGALFQLGLYSWTFFAMTVAFALVPEPEAVGVKYPGEDDDRGHTAASPLLAGGGEKDVEGGGGGGGGELKKKVKQQRRAGRYGHEIDQDTFGARVYLRLAKWGSRTLYPYVAHIAVLMAVAQFTDWYEITWRVEASDVAVTTRALASAALCFFVVVALSLRHAASALGWLLEPDITLLYSPVLQKV